MISAEAIERGTSEGRAERDGPLKGRDLLRGGGRDL